MQGFDLTGCPHGRHCSLASLSSPRLWNLPRVCTLDVSLLAVLGRPLAGVRSVLRCTFPLLLDGRPCHWHWVICVRAGSNSGGSGSACAGFTSAFLTEALRCKNPLLTKQKLLCYQKVKRNKVNMHSRFCQREYFHIEKAT